MSIKPLSKDTIKLINSTQVISSIYSAVKELVENSLDAGTHNIEVNLIDNGLSLIEVKDNGTGISKEDAPFMALPAYTSKITDFNDLDLLKTYGFRGEGLSAVCQVSDVTVCTKTDNDEAMTCYKLDYEGHVITSELSHGLRGTTVQMRNLFKNFPVRRNILNNKKKINQEIKAVEILLKTYCICQPSIRFIFRVNGDIIFTKSSCKNLSEAFKAVIGVQKFSKLNHLQKCFSKTELELFVPKKENADVTDISQSGYQFLSVNDRPIKSGEIEKRINKRVSEYFNQNNPRTNSRKFIFCLSLKVDSSMLDVNLEPNKDKVILQHEDNVLKEIDELLLNFYCLQDSQVFTQGDIIGKVSEMNIVGNEKEEEWPACKKRRLSSKNENICSVNGNVENCTKSLKDKTTRKSDNALLNGINNPVLSDSDSNDDENFTTKKKNGAEPMNLQESNSSELFDIVQEKSNMNQVAEETLSQLPKVDLGEDFDFTKKKKNGSEPMSLQESDSSELFDIVQEKSNINQVVEETLSQLPKVDLGEDFDWEEVVNKNKTPSASKGPIHQVDHQIDDVAWSKGHVTGLQGGIVVSNHDAARGRITDVQESEPFDFGKNIEIIGDDEPSTSHGGHVDQIDIDEFEWDVNLKNTRKRIPAKLNNTDKALNSSLKNFKKAQNAADDPKQPKIPFAGDNACLNSSAPSAFAMFCNTARSKIVAKHPELNPVEVAAYLNKEWKEISSEEREYYRDLANQHIQNLSNISLTQKSNKPSRSQVSEAQKDNNKKQLVMMLENMKKKKTEVKNESMIMRTHVPWDISLSLVTEKFRKPKKKALQSIVGSLNSLVWILRFDLQFLVFDITELHAQLDIEGYDISQINIEYVQSIVDRWFDEKGDMSVFHTIHSMET